jgi:hypothetical protein
MAIFAAGGLLVVAVLGYAGLRIWRQKNGGNSTDPRNRFRPRIGFTRLDGMESLSLLLANDAEEPVWTEQIEIFLSGLKADQQTAEATCHEIQKIRQTVRGGDMLPISLAQVIYNAAGNPQRKYSCLLASVVQYRIGDEKFEKAMDSYRIEMIGLKASKISSHRKTAPPLAVRPKSQDDTATAMKLK